MVTKADKQGRHIARRDYPAQPCEVCGRAPSGRGTVDRHHRNSDRLDNRPENIAFLCRKHHHEAHRASDGMVGGGPRPRVASMFREQAVARSKEARRLAAEGYTVPEIARRMGVDPWSVHRWFRKYPA